MSCTYPIKILDKKHNLAIFRKAKIDFFYGMPVTNEFAESIWKPDIAIFGLKRFEMLSLFNGIYIPKNGTIYYAREFKVSIIFDALEKKFTLPFLLV